jgi:hypothetical protein
MIALSAFDILWQIGGNGRAENHSIPVLGRLSPVAFLESVAVRAKEPRIWQLNKASFDSSFITMHHGPRHKLD